ERREHCGDAERADLGTRLRRTHRDNAAGQRHLFPVSLVRQARSAGRGPSPPTACSAPIVSVEQTPDNHPITPLAVELAVPLVDADDPESAAFVQRETRGVLGENPGHDLPESALSVGAA